ncbi:hypothetical protein H5410_051184 [Solanum commersonii]|uniref:Uncharacterized protein n=1 Tax=Solanum commersonii TaxID=4109 RepID=A0A9J5WZ97_SOLCO|nr:hypothetical protein H5410_051184 [Solanum commersonii]
MISCCCLSDNVDLGTASGKYYRVCCLSIIDPVILTSLRACLTCLRSGIAVSMVMKYADNIVKWRNMNAEMVTWTELEPMYLATFVMNDNQMTSNFNYTLRQR